MDKTQKKAMSDNDEDENDSAPILSNAPALSAAKIL